MSAAIIQPDLTDAPTERFGPSQMTHWSAAAKLDELGTYRQVFVETGESEPWTLRYEESIYVVDGSAWIVEMHPDGERRFNAATGSLTVIRPLTTVRYGGVGGTVLLLSITPVDWAEAGERRVEHCGLEDDRQESTSWN